MRKSSQFEGLTSGNLDCMRYVIWVILSYSLIHNSAMAVPPVGAGTWSESGDASRIQGNAQVTSESSTAPALGTITGSLTTAGMADYQDLYKIKFTATTGSLSIANNTNGDTLTAYVFDENWTVVATTTGSTTFSGLSAGGIYYVGVTDQVGLINDAGTPWAGGWSADSNTVYNYTVTLGNGDYAVRTPEPGSMFLVLAGIGAGAFRSRRKKGRSKSPSP